MTTITLLAKRVGENVFTVPPGGIVACVCGGGGTPFDVDGDASWTAAAAEEEDEEEEEDEDDIVSSRRTNAMHAEYDVGINAVDEYL